MPLPAPDSNNGRPKSYLVVTPAVAAVLCLVVLAIAAAFKFLPAAKAPEIPAAPAYPDLGPRVTELEQQLAAAKSAPPSYPNLTDRVGALEATQADLQRLLAEAQSPPEYPVLRNRIATLESELGATRDALAIARKGDVEAKLRVERDDLAGRITRLTREVTQLRSDRERMQQLLAQTGQQMRQASAEKNAPDGREIALAATVDELRSTRAALATAQDEASRAGEALAVLQRSASRTQADAADDRARLEQLRTANAALAKEIQQLKSTLAAGSVGSPPVAPAPFLRPATHTVVPGDSLTGLSRRYYGTPARWREIYDANAGLLGPGGNIRVGLTLRIP